MNVFYFCELQLISFTFKLQLLYKLNHKIRLSKAVCGISHFRFRLVFIKVCIFVYQMHELFDFKT